MRKDPASANHSSRSSQPQHDDQDIDRDAAPDPHKISISVDSVADNVEKMTSKAVTFLDFLKGKIYASFQDNIPIDEIKEMPDPYWRNRLGMFSCALMVVVFLYFVISSELVAHRAGICDLVYLSCCRRLFSRPSFNVCILTVGAVLYHGTAAADRQLLGHRERILAGPGNLFL
jgi:hypothetical protein